MREEAIFTYEERRLVVVAPETSGFLNDHKEASLVCYAVGVRQTHLEALKVMVNHKTIRD